MDQVTFVGYLVAGLAGLVGLFLAIGKPILNAVKVMTELNLNIKGIREELIKTQGEVDRSVEHARKGREKLWKAHDELSDVVDEHENRIGKLETTVRLVHSEHKDV